MYLSMVRRLTIASDVELHAFALMKTHDHLLVTPRTATALPRAMRRLGTTYVRYFNRKYARTGTLFNERYKGLIVTDDRYWLTCLRYIEQNPVRAAIVDRPEDYRWSSYRVHVGLEKSDWVKSHPVFDALGHELPQRFAVYRAICAASLTDAELIAQRLGTDPGRSQLRPGSVPGSDDPNSDNSARVTAGSGIDAPAA